MKANEAPEKIYIHVRANKELGTTWHGKKITNSDIEYIRTDAFIEKACEFLKSYRQDIYDGDGYIAGIVNDETIEDFKNYMRGE